MTHRAVVAQCKGHGHQGHSKDNVLRGTQKGQTFRMRHQVNPEGSTGIRDKGLKKQLHLGSKTKSRGIFERTVRQEITK
jgi:hypothetical protein